MTGILETLPLPPQIYRRPKPFFDRASERELLAENRLIPPFIRKSCAELAEAFNQAAAQFD